MYHFKAITVLIVSIFISLTIGLLTGFSINGNEILVYQQKNTIEQLEKALNKLKELDEKREKEEIELIKKQKEDYAFLEENLGEIFKDKLLNKKIIVLTLEKSDGEKFAEFLKKTGAEIEILNINEMVNLPLDSDFIIFFREKGSDDALTPNVLNSLEKYKGNNISIVVAQDFPITKKDERFFKEKKIEYVDEVDNVIKKYKLILMLFKK